MSKSFPITNEMREKVADQLTVKAVSKHAKGLAKTLETMRVSFWDAHLKRVDEILKIDRARWAELIQAGVVTAVARVEPRVDKTGEVVNLRANQRDPVDCKVHEVGKMLMRSEAFRPVFTHLRYNNYGYLVAILNHDYSVPSLNGLSYVDADSKIAKAGAKVQGDLLAIFTAAYDFREKTMDILLSCRTSAQLEQLFPEAAKLLPQPVKKRNELAPVELVQNVRGLMEKGVPDLA